MVVGLRPPPRATFPDGNRTTRHSIHLPTDRLAGAGGGHTLPIRQSVSRLREAASYTPGQRRHLVAGTGVAICPFTLCLSRRASDETDPAIPSALDGLKYFRLSPNSRLSTALGFGRHFRGRDRALRSDRSSSRRLSPPEVPQCLAVRRARKRCVLAPCTEMFRMTMYAAATIRSTGTASPRATLSH